jgi:hypothetical protein
MRALVDRSRDIKNLPESYKCHKPFIVHSNLIFKDSKLEKLKKIVDSNGDKLNACPTGIE